MRTVLSTLLVGLCMISCQENEPVSNNEFTGNETVYPLLPGSPYAISGTATLKEKSDGSTLISVQLNGTEGNIIHPVHLHLGNISTPDADIYALLNPVTGNTGKSETTLTTTANESVVTYKDLVKLNACIKIHLAEAGADKNIILAGGNIGASVTEASPSGRAALTVCKSE